MNVKKRKCIEEEREMRSNEKDEYLFLYHEFQKMKIQQEKDQYENRTLFNLLENTHQKIDKLEVIMEKMMGIVIEIKQEQKHTMEEYKRKNEDLTKMNEILKEENMEYEKRMKEEKKEDYFYFS